MAYMEKPSMDVLMDRLNDNENEVEHSDDEYEYLTLEDVENYGDGYLEHYGTPRHSGRYPWGSGEKNHQRTGDLLSRYEDFKKQGLSEKEIAKALNITNQKGEPSTTRLRVQLDMAKEDRRADQVATAKRLRYKEGLSLKEVADRMGFKNDSSVRSLLNEETERKSNAAKATAEFLKKQVDEKGMIDVGGDVEYELNISRQKLDQALYRLELEGYNTYGGRVPQATNNGQLTTIKVLCPPGTEHKEIFNYDQIHSVTDYITRDGGETYEKAFHYPASMDSKRLMVRYAEDGGIQKDGVMELRRGCPDLDLGGSKISQVRILVDGKKYIKGMAVYGDDKDFPPGVDVIFNTNKTKKVAKLDVLKDIKDDPDNPFGSAIKEHGGQYWYADKNGNKKLGLINKRADQGDWNEWKDKLPSQFLSKQPLKLAERQLNLAIDNKQREFDEIMSLTNPTVKKKMLESFSTDCDSAAVHLYAAALPRQKYHVILPITSMKDTEIYAPKYQNGEKVALVRYPHGGTFEIPILTVNNKNAVAKKMLGTDIDDAVGINSKVAERLSGADFDGDTVMVIPTGGKNKINIKSTPQLKGLEGFDPKTSYGTEKRQVKNPETGKMEDAYFTPSGKQIKVMKDTQNQMGRISNLITDMTLQGASDDELAAAVRHSMVVIDAAKHKLDYKQSEIDNHISTLKNRYQGYTDKDGNRRGGASTLISRAKSETSVEKRQGTPKINQKGKEWYDPNKPEGSLIYKKADDLYYPDRKFNKKTGMVEIKTANGGKVTYDPQDKTAKDKYLPVSKVDKNGNTHYYSKDGSVEYKIKTRTEKSTKMADTDDARTLISEANTPMERAYANYANTMKAMANKARLEMVNTGGIKVSSEARNKYAKEIESLDLKLQTSLKNHPRERQAQLEASSRIEAKKKANPDMKTSEIKKMSQQELTKARLKYGAKRETIDITENEWKAIQAGAISETKLKKILNRADMDKVRQLATPRKEQTVNTAKINRMNAMRANGYTIEEIAKALGVSTSSVTKNLK